MPLSVSERSLPRSAVDQTGVDIVATLAALDENPLLLASNARQLMRRCGTSELLTGLMAKNVGDPSLQVTRVLLSAAECC